MQTCYESLIDQLHRLHGELFKALDEFPPDAVDWVPGPEMNSLSVLIVHLSGAERYWVGDVVKGDPSFRVRETEFQARGLTVDALKQRIIDLDTYESASLDTMQLVPWDEERVSPRDGQRITVARALLHALQHTAVHLGHIQILSQQWKQRAG